MSQAKLLANAMATVIRQRTDSGVAFLRMPELVSPMPVAELLTALEDHGDIRVALFLHEVSAEPVSTLPLTTDVAEAIDWRNDSCVDDALVVVGHLERDRASGLADLPVVTVSEVRRVLFGLLAAEMKAENVPEPAQRLIRTLSEFREVTDLLACADFCASLSPVNSHTAERTRSELWRLGLLPDTHDKEIDQRRLSQNLQLVGRLRAMDASTRQRLIRHAAAGGGSDYSPLRRFGSTGEVRHLSALDYDGVLGAVRASGSAGAKAKKGDSNQPETATILIALMDADFDEQSFTSQIREAEGRENPSMTVGGVSIQDWDYTDYEPVDSLFADPDEGSGYATQAGSIEEIPAGEPFPRPGSGHVEWRSLEVLSDKLRKLERERAKRETSPCADLVTGLISLRRALEPFVSSIPNEGVRLFLGSKSLRTAATELVETWIKIWKQLEVLRRELPAGDHVHVRRLAEQLASTDLRITVHQGVVDAYVLPLHPLFLEARVRAAELFSKVGENSPELFDLVIGSLDPAMPSISILREGAPVSLGYAGEHRGTLHYSREPRQVDSADVVQTIRQMIQRFTNVHPYAELSLAVGLFNPPVKTAKAILRWLGESGVADRVSLHVFAARGNDEELREALDEAREELVSGEISASTFESRVVVIEDISELPTALSDSDLVPHILFLFDTADIEQSSQGASFATPPLGSLISEWVFDTDPLEDSRPLIMPRSGSSLLTEYVEAQAGLFEMPLPSQQRSPLLSQKVEETLESLADRTTWIVLCEGISSLVPPLQMGDLHLVGRKTSSSHVAFVYSAQILLLVEPVLAYLQQSTWIDPDGDSAVKFLLGTVRMALPEGLLGFFKTTGALSRESVLGRLGLAASVAFLEAEAGGDRLLVSLDTDGARRWLGLRDGSERRADLLVIYREGETTVVEAVEVKSRSEDEPWVGSPPPSVKEALEQTREMEAMLRKVFRLDQEEPFTPSRREILKRQVFLEALQQWEPIRETNEARYRDLITELNDVFSGDRTVNVRSRIFLVSSTRSDEEATKSVTDGRGAVPVVLLGVPWLKKALQQQPGSDVEIPLELLDELGFKSNTVIALEPSGGQSDGTERVGVTEHEEVVHDNVQADEREQERLSSALRDALVARKAPFKAISIDEIVMGPSVVQIPFTVTAGAKLASLQSQEADLARDLGVQSVRIVNLIGRPGYAVAELPRQQRSIPDIGEIERRDQGGQYPELALGAAVDSSPVWAPLDALPHLLVAGTTGSGKSVFLRSLLWQLTSLYRPDEVDLVLIDAKGLADYLDFADAPQFHSSSDFHSGVAGGLELLQDIVEVRLPERTRIFREYASAALRRDIPTQVTNLRQLREDALAQGTHSPLRPLVVIIDEFAELVLAGNDRKRFEQLITRFTQVARAVGGHLVAATQRPSTDIVTGVMKSNFARVALRVQQAVDSRVILDENGAELLLGRGDLLFKSSDVGLIRLQGYSAIGPYRF